MPTRYRGTPKETRALDAFIKLMRATDSLHGALTGELEAAGITQGQLAILEALWHCGPMCQRDLGAKILRSQSNTTTVLDNLERSALVRRVRSAADRRHFDVSLTPAGRRLIAGVFPGHAARIAALFAALTASEQAELGRLCKKLGTGIRSDASRATVATSKASKKRSTKGGAAAARAPR